jgi:pimeloyl-ACP methyl ester carboxylesterase
MPPTLVLVHSPFLGPATWQSTARALAHSGRRVRVPSLRAVATSSPPYWPAGVEAIVHAAPDEPVVLVPHSNAGLYMPAAVDALRERVRGVVFVDAAVPGAGHHSTSEFLSTLPSVDGLLPPWTSWWADADVAELFPDAHTRAEVEAEQPRMPLAYYDQLPPAPHDWAAAVPCGYLWFGVPYNEGAAQAQDYGWPTAHLPGTHLHMLSDPAGVASAILQIAQDWR